MSVRARVIVALVEFVVVLILVIPSLTEMVWSLFSSGEKHSSLSDHPVLRACAWLYLAALLVGLLMKAWEIRCFQKEPRGRAADPSDKDRTSG